MVFADLMGQQSTTLSYSAIQKEQFYAQGIRFKSFAHLEKFILYALSFSKHCVEQIFPPV